LLLSTWKEKHLLGINGCIATDLYTHGELSSMLSSSDLPLLSTKILKELSVS
jgi:hypothetical protein